MKRFKLILIYALALLAIVSCADSNKVNYNEKRSISTECITHGFIEDNQETKALWCEGEKLYLYRHRGDEWTPTPMALSQGANSNSAIFTGSTIVSNTYTYCAIRPLAAVATVRSNGAATIIIEPNNIFLAEENSSLVTPQIGNGDTKKMEFTNIFGVLKFPNSEGDTSLNGATMVEFILNEEEKGFHGTFEYNFKNRTLRTINAQKTVSRKFDAPLSTPLYLALPEGEYATIKAVVSYSTGDQKLFSAEDVTITRNTVTTAENFTTVVLSSVVGGWHIKSFCGAEATADLYMEFLHDNTFNLYQRTENMAYQTYSGTYTIDEATSTISGTYSDGTIWADSYRFSLNEEKELVFEGVNSGEISIYERAEIPTILPERTSRSVADVKPL